MIKVIFITIAIFIVWAIRYIRSRKKNSSLYAIPNGVKENYKKLSIPFNKLNVQTRGYYESDEDSLYPTRMRVLDALVDKSQVNKTYKEVSVLSYDGLYIRGKSVLLKSNPVYLPATILHQKLKKQKLIDIYFDENKLELPYYDLSFLNKPLE